VNVCVYACVCMCVMQACVGFDTTGCKSKWPLNACEAAHDNNGYITWCEASLQTCKNTGSGM